MKSFLNEFPQTPLTPEREQELFAAGDREAIVLHAMVPAFRYVRRHYGDSNSRISEALSLCYAALSKAIKNFSPGKGKFIIYALPYLRGEVCAEWRKKDAVRNAAKHETPLENDAHPAPLETDSVDPQFDQIHWRELWAQVEPVIRTSLSPVEIQVLEDRYRFSMTLQETGNHIGKSRERVRQIETKALQKLRGSLLSFREL